MMAQKKSKIDIFQSEKYMDDAVFSAFLNLHRAAKRKSEYIWATQKFNSLDSIWGDPVELESDKVLFSTSKVGKNPKFDSKILKQQYCGESNLVEVMPDNVRKTGLYYEQTIEVPENQKALDTISSDPVELERYKDLHDTSMMNRNSKYKSKLLKQQYCGTDNKKSTSQLHQCNLAEVIMPDNARKTGLHPEQNPKVSASRKASLLPNFVNRNEGKGTKSEYSNPAKKVLNADEQHHSQYTYGNAEKTCLTVENSSFNAVSNAEKNKGVKSHNCETEFRSIKSKLNYSDKPRKEKAIERIKEKRHMSSSVNSFFPKQKQFSVENPKRDAADKWKDYARLKTMLELKIFKNAEVFDFTLELSDFNRMKKRFPKLEEILPEIDGDRKELNYSIDAVKIVLGFLRNLRYSTPDERTAVEVLAASKSWEMYQFHDEFKQKFSENLSKHNVPLAYGAAVHYDLREICDTYNRKLGDDLPKTNRPYRPRKCYVSVSKYIEPREFCIPLKTSTSELNDNFDRDIKNEIRFRAIGGSYVITGFHILLDIENETDSVNLEFFYTVRNFKSSNEEELEVRKPLRRNIAIHFKKSLVINQYETAEIVVESSIKPYLCFAIPDNLVGRYDESQFNLKVKSNYKVENSNEKRFLIGKLLYYPKT